MCCDVPLQLGFHAKPIGLLNSEGFYDPLLACFKHLVDEVISRLDARAKRAVDMAFASLPVLPQVQGLS
jgi:predicted Rossmann-fold nucleotide-binding protein